MTARFRVGQRVVITSDGWHRGQAGTVAVVHDNPHGSISVDVEGMYGPRRLAFFPEDLRQVDGSVARADGSRDAMKTPSDPSGRRHTTTEGAPVMSTTTPESIDHQRELEERALRVCGHLSITGEPFDMAALAPRLEEVGPLLDAVPEWNRDVAEYVAVVTLDQAVSQVIQRFIPDFPCPEASRIPKWVEEVEEGRWDSTEQAWVRYLTWQRGEADGAGVKIGARHVMTAVGAVRVEDVHVEVLEEIVETPEDAREVARWLLEAADALEGPRSANHLGARPEPMGTQRAVVQNIRARIALLPVNQNEFGIGAGYAPEEFSMFMTGRRHMDLEDVDRIARALGTDPLELLAVAEVD